MRRLHAVLTLIVIVALVATLISSRRAQNELQKQLQTLTDANTALKESLGELTTAITRKEQQIDDLQRSGRRNSPAMPPHQKKKTSANEL
jgi:predicted  nucleic acid-binding Zn-ribbon protein